jgi:SAM-dependent methyltransferase
VNRILRSAQPLGDVLEVGAGEGGFATRLAAVSTSYTGYEPDPESFQVAKGRLERLPDATIVNAFLPLTPIARVDVVCAFEVLEHVERDEEALAQWVEWLNPGGMCIVSVPARPERFGKADVAVGHYRRYSLIQLRNLLAQAGLTEVLVIRYGFPLGIALDFMKNYLIKVPGAEPRSTRTARSGRIFQPTRLLGPLIGIAVTPFRLLQRCFRESRLNTGLVGVGSRSR